MTLILTRRSRPKTFSARPPFSRRRTLQIALFLVAFSLLSCSLLVVVAVFLSLPFGMASELVQVAGEKFSQRVFPSTPAPVSFPSARVDEAAQHAAQADIERLMADLRWLADDDRQGREQGAAGEDEVGAWLTERMETLGLRPFEEAGLEQYAQAFESATPGRRAENIIGVLPGSGQPRRFLLIGAHYDHLGVGEDGQVYNGADDDATGVAAVLEAARVFSAADQRPRDTLVFVLFSGEEGGRRGSTALGRLLRGKGFGEQARMLNLEVLGAAPGKGAFLDVWDEETRATHALVTAVQAAGEALSVPITRLGRDPGSDATRLLAYGVPSVTVDVAWEGGENHPHLHTPEDDADAIDPQGFLNAARVAIASAWLLANE